MIKCQRCGYQWTTKSKNFYVSCPKCLTKVKVNKDELLSNIGDQMKPKINFTIDGRVLTTRRLEGFDKGEISSIKRTLSKVHNIPEIEIMTEIED